MPRTSQQVSVEDLISKEIFIYVDGVLRRAAPALRDKFIRERLSNPTPPRGRKGQRIVLPKSAGLRKRKGWLQDSVRMTVTAPRSGLSRFFGTQRLSSKVGGGRVQYAHKHENEGRMQFGRVTLEEYARLIQEIRDGVTKIAAKYGGTVSGN